VRNDRRPHGATPATSGACGSANGRSQGEVRPPEDWFFTVDEAAEPGNLLDECLAALLLELTEISPPNGGVGRTMPGGNGNVPSRQSYV
jgi:hypothetical protein